MEKYKGYKHYKESGVEWIGEVPEEWNVMRVAGLYEFISEKVSDEEYPALSVTRQGIVPQMENVAKTMHGDNRKRVSVGDFVINSRADRPGSCGISEFDGSVSVICHVLRPLNNKIKREYGHFLFRNNRFSQEFYRWGRGIVDDLWSTRQDEMKKIMIPLPSLDDQTQIAYFLNQKTAQIDSLIADKEKLIVLLEEQRQSLITESVTKGLNPNANMKDSGVEWIGKIPDHWEMKKFSYCVSIANGQVDPRKEPYSDMILIAPNHIESGSGSLLETVTASEQGADSGKYLCKKGEVIYSKIRPGLRKACIAPSECICSADMYPMKAHRMLKSEFLLWLLLSDNFTQYALLESDRVAMPKINRESLSQIRIPIPPLNEQELIVDLISTKMHEIKELVDELKVQILKLTEYRQSLIFEAVTGKIDVRDVAAEVVTS